MMPMHIDLVSMHKIRFVILILLMVIICKLWMILLLVCNYYDAHTAHFCEMIIRLIRF